MKDEYLIGIDFGSDSARAVLINAENGAELGESVHAYPRWAKGLYSDNAEARFRHHPLDYMESLEAVLKGVIKDCPNPEDIRAIGIDTTASTPCLVDKSGTPLSMLTGNEDNPDAMFVLWKDHSGEAEAAEFNEVIARTTPNYSAHCGGHYSAENFWPKVLKCLRHSPGLKAQAFTAIELCDWLTATLVGWQDVSEWKTCLCAAGAKRFWATDWDGYPTDGFFSAIDPCMLPIVHNLPVGAYTADKKAGNLTAGWAARLGLSTDVTVCVGNIDSYAGAIGAGVGLGTMAMNIGTSACYMAVMPVENYKGKIVEGVFAQVDDGILPDMTGFEVGLSAFGDIFAWLKRTLTWALDGQHPELADGILGKLAEAAQNLTITEKTPVATDYLNGRRNPRPDNSLTGTITGLRLGTTPVELYYALAEAAAFATRANIDNLADSGVRIDKLIAIGGIAHKSPFVMQLLADVTGRSIEVSGCKQACALGASICAATAAGLYPSVTDAQKALCADSVRTYTPRGEKRGLLDKRYAKYMILSDIK